MKWRPWGREFGGVFILYIHWKEASECLVVTWRQMSFECNLCTCVRVRAGTGAHGHTCGPSPCADVSDVHSFLFMLMKHIDSPSTTTDVVCFYGCCREQNSTSISPWVAGDTIGGRERGLLHYRRLPCFAEKGRGPSSLTNICAIMTLHYEEAVLKSRGRNSVQMRRENQPSGNEILFNWFNYVWMLFFFLMFPFDWYLHVICTWIVISECLWAGRTSSWALLQPEHFCLIYAQSVWVSSTSVNITLHRWIQDISKNDNIFILCERNVPLLCLS